MKIRNKKEFANIINDLKLRYAKTYTDRAPHEYCIVKENNEELAIIRALNKYIEDNYDEIEIFWGKEYKVLFVDNYKYWTVEESSVTNIINRNWDFKNEDGTTNSSITESYKGK